MASEKIQNILEEIKALTLLEANELKNAICEEFGVSADAPVMVAGGAAAPAAEATKDSWDVVLTGAGQTKMAVIKVVKEITGLGLKESKEIVDGCPKAVKEGVSEAEADEIKKKLEEAGASVEVK
ncbi:MAG: 50S ribosomal protein L7/L12 [Oscillospiraceae bacterium]|nr:50S ribosomal protein L7/L12 [Oscillospiraceae bacterium]